MMTQQDKLKLVEQWNSMRGDDTLRLSYPLNESSTVIDIGAYVGDWTSKISEKYGSTVWSYEPVPHVALKLLERFSTRRSIRVMSFGVLDKDCVKKIGFIGGHPDSSSVYIDGGSEFMVMFRDASKLLQDIGTESVDLIKINTEGSEYAILERIISSDQVNRYRNIQVQFHDFVDGSEKRRSEIRTALSSTHEETYCVPFVWENWRLK